MKKESKKPKKQRKKFYNMPLHTIQKSLVGHLSKSLRKTLGKRSVSLRKNDKVRVMRGSHKGTEGKIIKIDYKKRQVFLEKLVRKKADGREIPIPLQASNLLVLELDRSDNKRLKKLKRKGVEEKIEESEEKKKEKTKKETQKKDVKVKKKRKK